MFKYLPQRVVARHVAVAVFAAMAVAQPARTEAQERGFPILNSMGRYLGYGYTQGGYHAPANGQLPLVRKMHPASDYPSGQLQYAYNRGYQPMRPHQANYGLPAMQPRMPAAGPFPSPAQPTAPAQPAGPPPEWLKEYLKGKEAGGSAEEIERPTPQSNAAPVRDPYGFDDASQSSPSDRMQNDLLDADANEGAGADEDDDLLLLNSGDLSIGPTGQPTLAPPLVVNRVKATTVSVLTNTNAPLNRYRQAAAQRTQNR